LSLSKHDDWMAAGLGLLGLVFVVGAFVCVVMAAAEAGGQTRQLEPLRTKAWADMVADCEAHGGVAVPRATRVLGRSAETPACVPQLGEPIP
jgi:hypothetical protein